MEEYLNPYTDYGDYTQERYDYQDGRRRSKGSTTLIIDGRTPSYNISFNSKNKGGYSKGSKW